MKKNIKKTVVLVLSLTRTMRVLIIIASSGNNHVMYIMSTLMDTQKRYHAVLHSLKKKNKTLFLAMILKHYLNI